MNPGVCINPYTPHGYLAPIPLSSAYRTRPNDSDHPGLHDVGIRTLRVGAHPLLESAKPPASIDDTWHFNFNLMNQWLLPIGGAIAGEAWMDIYVNPGGCPPEASEGQPAYVSELGISRWPPTSPETLESYCGGAWWNDPKNPGLGIHDFNQDPNRTDSVTLPGGKVLTGPELAAIDQKMPPRPYLVNPPHRDPQYAFDLGRQIMQQLGWFVRYVGIENEPGGGLLRRQEKRSEGKDANGFPNLVPNMMRDRMFPEIYEPFAAGVRSVALRVADVNKGWRIVGCEADSAEILARYLDADEKRYRARPPLSVCDKISIHPYGAIAGGPPSYATMEEFLTVLKDRKSYREVCIGEIGGDPEALYEFTLEVVAKSGKEWPRISDIYYLRPEIFYEPGSSWTTLGAWDSKKSVLSPVGLKFQKLFAQMNNERRAV